MTFEQAYAIKNMCNDMCAILQLKEAMAMSYPIKLSSVNVEPQIITNTELSEILDRHLKEAFTEMLTRIGEVKVDEVGEELE